MMVPHDRGRRPLGRVAGSPTRLDVGDRLLFHVLKEEVDMAGKRGPESFLKRQRERRKQQEAQEKITRRRERSAQKREAKTMPESGSAGGESSAAPFSETPGSAPEGQSTSKDVQ